MGDGCTQGRTLYGNILRNSGPNISGFGWTGMIIENGPGDPWEVEIEFTEPFSDIPGVAAVSCCGSSGQGRPFKGSPVCMVPGDFAPTVNRVRLEIDEDCNRVAFIITGCISSS
jgi:hypothetical protein